MSVRLGPWRRPPPQDLGVWPEDDLADRFWASEEGPEDDFLAAWVYRIAIPTFEEEEKPIRWAVWAPPSEAGDQDIEQKRSGDARTVEEAIEAANEALASLEGST